MLFLVERKYDWHFHRHLKLMTGKENRRSRLSRLRKMLFESGDVFFPWKMYAKNAFLICKIMNVPQLAIVPFLILVVLKKPEIFSQLKTVSFKF